MTDIFHGRIHPHGRLVIPAGLRHALNLTDHTHVVLTREGDSLRITTFEAGIREAQAIAASCIDPDADLIDDLKKLRSEHEASLD